jgi:hypothetical protein
MVSTLPLCARAGAEPSKGATNGAAAAAPVALKKRRREK